MRTPSRMFHFRPISLAASVCLASTLLLATTHSGLAGTTYVFRAPLPGDPAQSLCTPGSITETTPDASLQLNVAAQGCTTITVTLQGAAGGNGGDGGTGGAGSQIQFTLPAASYAGTWTGVVGQGGLGAGSSTYSGANGGGYTSVSFNGKLLGVAGGGGGAGDDEPGGDGGLDGYPGASSPSCATGGQGGTDSSGGAPGAICSGYNSGNPLGSASGALTGGSAEYTSGVLGVGAGGLGDLAANGFAGSSGNGGAGGGGGGYYGGGGGTYGGIYQTGGGGGGGSDYALPSAGNVVDTPGGGGQPSSAPGGNGSNGSITISWN